MKIGLYECRKCSVVATTQHGTCPACGHEHSVGFAHIKDIKV